MTNLQIHNCKIVQIPNLVNDENVGKAIKCERGFVIHEGKKLIVSIYRFLLGVEGRKGKETYHTILVKFIEGNSAALCYFEDFSEAEYSEVLKSKECPDT